MDNCWTDSDKELGPEQLKMVCDPEIFPALRSAGLKVVMCTNDTRARAQLMLDHFGLTNDFDLVVARKFIGPEVR